jgi:Ser/Thr protein kinase RdoA (MazF antagonist)
MSFEKLTPDAILTSVEIATGRKLTGFMAQLPSYINRVYELRSPEGEKLIAKYYRPGRWSREAILDEHRFVKDCGDDEIPVVAPLELVSGGTLGSLDDMLFAVYPRRAGRQLEINSDQDWTRLGSLIGRMHCTGARQSASSRITIDPRLSTAADIDWLYEKVIPVHYREQYRSTVQQLIAMSTELFEGVERIRIHGDFHRGNILDRLEQGLLVIDFDDMAMGPAVQDLWLLLPDRAPRVTHEIELLIEGYERFRRFDKRSLRCIEPLRAMRMIYFLAWCSRQVNDFQFKKTFPDWGSDAFWGREINDLREQIGYVMEALE